MAIKKTIQLPNTKTYHVGMLFVNSSIDHKFCITLPADATVWRTQEIHVRKLIAKEDARPRDSGIVRTLVPWCTTKSLV